MGTHTHHKIPKHAGGTNDPENLVELTVEEHAAAHQKLYEEYGRWQDFLAWKALSGQVDKDDIRRMLTSLALKGKPKSADHIEKIRKNQSGKKHSEKTKALMSQTRKGRKRPWSITSLESNEKRSQTMRGITKPVLKCPHCGKEGGAPQMKQWHFNNCKRKK